MYVKGFFPAALLDVLKEYAQLPNADGDFHNLRVFYPYWLCRRMADKLGHEDVLYRFAGSKIDKEDIAEASDRVMMAVRPSMRSDLERIGNLSGGAFIYSLWKGYLDEPGMGRFVEWAEDEGLAVPHLHTSGHADVETLQRVVKTLRPQTIMPIHTFHPESYDSLPAPVKELEDGRTHRL